MSDSHIPTARVHGGPDGHGVPLHDFSSNSNACGPCLDVLYAVKQADASRYPDASYTALRQQLAEFHQVTQARVVLAASASEFIFRITALSAQRGVRAVCLPPHAYGDYAQAAQAHGMAHAPEPGVAALCWACDPSSPMGAPHAQSVMMDSDTLTQHADHWGHEPQAQQRDLPRLNVDERVVYDALRDNRIRPGLRLEQERIGFSWVQQALAALPV